MWDLKLLIDDLFNLKFKSNTFADKGHENSIKGILLKHSLSEIDKVEWKKNNNEIYEILKDRNEYSIQLSMYACILEEWYWGCWSLLSLYQSWWGRSEVD
jgi:hypothetical protein